MREQTKARERERRRGTREGFNGGRVLWPRAHDAAARQHLHIPLVLHDLRDVDAERARVLLREQQHRRADLPRDLAQVCSVVARQAAHAVRVAGHRDERVGLAVREDEGVVAQDAALFAHEARQRGGLEQAGGVGVLGAGAGDGGEQRAAVGDAGVHRGCGGFAEVPQRLRERAVWGEAVDVVRVGGRGRIEGPEGLGERGEGEGTRRRPREVVGVRRVVELVGVGEGRRRVCKGGFVAGAEGLAQADDARVYLLGVW